MADTKYPSPTGLLSYSQTRYRPKISALKKRYLPQSHCANQYIRNDIDKLTTRDHLTLTYFNESVIEKSGRSIDARIGPEVTQPDCCPSNFRVASPLRLEPFSNWICPSILRKGCHIRQLHYPRTSSPPFPHYRRKIGMEWNRSGFHP